MAKTVFCAVIQKDTEFQEESKARIENKTR